MGRVKDAASGEDRIRVVDERLVGSISGVGGEAFLQVVELQQQRVVEALVGDMRREDVGVLAPQRDAGLGNIHPDDRVSIRSVADEFSVVGIEPTASRRLVEKFIVDYEAHVDSFYP